ncbi:hypothetical protein NB607_15210 [Vibrio alginolyticus]|uniref:hypothetical protein n=1 Tax=Vibrio alginolyticus TaxID=663 RepID=UPI00215C4534|nr:hypothetical protein [Vibrio alginolyticus]MCS0038317.1 hypothetical protein [Vibrio alginolyticus]
MILLAPALLTACSLDSPSQSTGDSSNISIVTYNFLYTGGSESSITMNAIYDRPHVGEITTVLHDTLVYGASHQITLKQVSNSYGYSNIKFELRDTNSNLPLASEQKTIFSHQTEKIVIAYTDITESSPEYAFAFINKPSSRPNLISSPLYIINLLGEGDANIFIDNMLFQSYFSKFNLSNQYSVALSSPLSEVSIKNLNNINLATCDLSNTSFNGKQSLIIFARKSSGSSGCYLYQYK